MQDARPCPIAHGRARVIVSDTRVRVVGLAFGDWECARANVAGVIVRMGRRAATLLVCTRGGERHQVDDVPFLGALRAVLALGYLHADVLGDPLASGDSGAGQGRYPCRAGTLAITASEVAVESVEPSASWRLPREAITAVERRPARVKLLAGRDWDLYVRTGSGEIRHADWLTAEDTEHAAAILAAPPFGPPAASTTDSDAAASSPDVPTRPSNVASSPTDAELGVFRSGGRLRATSRQVSFDGIEPWVLARADIERIAVALSKLERVDLAFQCCDGGVHWVRSLAPQTALRIFERLGGPLRVEAAARPAFVLAPTPPSAPGAASATEPPSQRPEPGKSPVVVPPTGIRNSAGVAVPHDSTAPGSILPPLPMVARKRGSSPGDAARRGDPKPEPASRFTAPAPPSLTPPAPVPTRPRQPAPSRPAPPAPAPPLSVNGPAQQVATSVWRRCGAGAALIVALLVASVVLGVWSGAGRQTSGGRTPLGGVATRAPTGTSRTTSPSVAAPLPLTVTCAVAVDHASGRLCVRTVPGATLSVTIKYCAGFGPPDRNPSLTGAAKADALGNYVWTWAPNTTCRGGAMAFITASLGARVGYFDYAFTVR